MANPTFVTADLFKASAKSFGFPTVTAEELSQSSLLGRGGYGSVFRVTYKGQACAVKQWDRVADYEKEVEYLRSPNHRCDLIESCVQQAARI